MTLITEPIYKPEDIPMIFGAHKLAELLGVSESQARRIMARDDFHVVHISARRCRIRRDDFLNWLERMSG